MSDRPKLAVWKFASCDGCQLSVLDASELFALAERLEISHFLEMTRAVVEGPYDVSLVEGSVTTAHDAQRIREVRARSRVLITIGACATAGGIQALRNFGGVDGFRQAVYARPEWIETLGTSTPIADHVPVDFELRGCPVNPRQLEEVLAAFLAGRKPAIPSYSVCVPCKRAGTVCVTVARGTPCLGPITQAGCGALCPRYHRGCYGCFGPSESPNTAALAARAQELGVQPPELVRLLRSFNALAPAFREESARHE
ncbi:MAG: oxidoreductase [Planctomycetota bacterium]